MYKITKLYFRKLIVAYILGSLLNKVCGSVSTWHISDIIQELFLSFMVAIFCYMHIGKYHVP